MLAGDRPRAVEEAGDDRPLAVVGRLDRRLATDSADSQNIPVAEPRLERPATSMNSVLTGPGQTAVSVTPVPLSSSWTASLRLRTNAFVAA